MTIKPTPEAPVSTTLPLDILDLVTWGCPGCGYTMARHRGALYIRGWDYWEPLASREYHLDCQVCRETDCLPVKGSTPG